MSTVTGVIAYVMRNVFSRARKTDSDMSRRITHIPTYPWSCTGFFLIAHFCSVYSLCSFVYFAIATVHLVVFIAYIIVISVIFIYMLFSCKCA